MGAFLGISLWVALATVVPGLITIACLYGAVAIVNPGYFECSLTGVFASNDWVWAGIGVAAMVLTQATGVLLESLLVSKQWLGPETRSIDLPEGIDPYGERHLELKPYFEYQGLYILLSELGENEDAQGHLKRALAQFFLTNNTLVSYSAGIVFGSVALLLNPSWPASGRFAGYAGGLVLCLILSYKVAVIRFDVMARSLWATRRRRFMSPTMSAGNRDMPPADEDRPRR